MTDAEFFASCLQRIATGPELSKDLSLDEAQRAMALILRGRVHPVQAGIYLIALRMKRETVDENRGILNALREAASFAYADVDDLVEFADPYDGVNRHLPVSPFLSAVLAACGVPAVCHGIDILGPKYGLTFRRVLTAAGKTVDLDPSAAAERLADPQIGWAYVDVRRYCPELDALNELRRLIVKRPCLATLEKLTGPVRARRNHMIVGYVHKAYPELLTTLARHAGYDSALVLRGVEGGVTPAIKGGTAYRRYRGAENDDDIGAIDAAEAQLNHDARATPLPAELEFEGKLAHSCLDAAAQAAAQAGVAALAGESGPSRDHLTLSAALILWHLGRVPDLRAGAAQAARALDNGQALQRFERFD